MKKISIRLDNRTIEQIRQLAHVWGLPKQRHNTEVISRVVDVVWMLEIGTDEMVEKYKIVKKLKENS